MSKENVVEERAEDLQKEKIELSDTDNGVQFLKDAVLASSEKNPEIFAEQLLAHMDEDAKKLLLKDLIVHKAITSSKKMKANYDMNELNPDWEKGAYPYVNPYDRDLYQKQIYQLQVELVKLLKWVVDKKKKIVIIFEGRDAAGKGGTIKRFTENLNPRQARIAALPKPNETEIGQWFFQRYIAHLPTFSEMVFFDRSWYNRAVVEPVMGFCTHEQYVQFMREVPNFEKALTSSGIILFKLWLDVSQKEQKKRFKARRCHPLKRWKLSPVDLEGLSKWDEYTHYIHEMFETTDMPYAPWTVIRSDDKLRARLNAIRVVLRGIEYTGRNLDVIGEIDPLIVSRPNHQLKGIPYELEGSDNGDPAKSRKKSGKGKKK